MAVKQNSVVSMNYVLKDKDGTILDQSRGGQPLVYLHGHSNIIPGLESELANKGKGDKLQVHVTPDKGYGTLDPEKRFAIERRQLGAAKIEPGMMLQLEDDEGGTMVAHVISVDDEHIQLDGNHPMAGKDLFFDIEIVDVRDATQEEVSHGHVHGPGGHHHH